MKLLGVLLMVMALSSVAWAQGTPRVPAHIGVRSLTARQVFTHDLYVDGGATYGDEVAAGSFANSTGGEVYLPAGLEVDPGSFVCLDAPTCNLRIYRGAAANMVINGGGTPIACIDGLNVQGVIEGGSLQANSCELAGGATACSLRSADGSGATADAGLELVAGNPNGWVTITRPAGLRTASVGPLDAGFIQIVGAGLRFEPHIGAPPPCNDSTAGYYGAYAIEQFADGGWEYLPWWCDSHNARTVADAIILNASSETGGVGFTDGDFWLWVNPSVSKAETWYCTFGITGAGTGAGSYTVNIKQGANTVCASPSIPCGAAANTLVWRGDGRPGTGDGPCVGVIEAMPAGATGATYDSYVVTGVYVGVTNCGTKPRGRLTCFSRRQSMP